MAVTYPGANTGYVPNHEATGKMVVDFSRNPSKFAVNQYCQLVPVKQSIGYYLEMTVEEAGRILNTNLNDLVWPDGNDRPSGTDGTESFQFLAYRCERYAPSARLGDLAIEQASWDIIARHAAIKAQQAMTARTQKAITALTTAGNYASTHTSAVASISGNTGTWAASTTARQDIKRSLNTAADLILTDTLAGVDVEDLVIVMSPTCARKIAECQEIVDHIKGSPDALAQFRGELPGENTMFGLPNKLYGWKVIIEKTVKVTSKKGATKVATQVLGSTTPFMCSRPGGLVGIAGAPSFSTATIFVYETDEMAVETLDDRVNRRKLVSVVDNNAVVLTAPVSGYLFTSAV